MLERQYHDLLNQLCQKFGIDETLVYHTIPNIYLSGVYRQNTTELQVKDQTFYLSGSNIFQSVFKLDQTMIVAKQRGYLKDNKIYIKKN